MTTDKLTILCDVDGVVANLVGKLCDELNVRGHYVVPADIKHHDFKLSMSPAAVDEAYRIMGEPGFCHGLPWYDGAREFLDGLVANTDYEVLAVTSPFGSPTWMHERTEWLKGTLASVRHVLNVPSQFKQLVRGDVLIEDHPGTLHDWLEVNEDGFGILIDRPWNQRSSGEYRAHERMWRAKTIYHATDLVRVFHEAIKGDYRPLNSGQFGVAA